MTETHYFDFSRCLFFPIRAIELSCFISWDEITFHAFLMLLLLMPLLAPRDTKLLILAITNPLILYDILYDWDWCFHVHSRIRPVVLVHFHSFLSQSRPFILPLNMNDNRPFSIIQYYKASWLSMCWKGPGRSTVPIEGDIWIVVSSTIFLKSNT